MTNKKQEKIKDIKNLTAYQVLQMVKTHSEATEQVIYNYLKLLI